MRTKVFQVEGWMGKVLQRKVTSRGGEFSLSEVLSPKDLPFEEFILVW